MNETERQILSDVTLDAPWALVEDYAKMPRWRPEDVNGGVDHLVAALGKAGVPVTVLEPEGPQAVGRPVRGGEQFARRQLPPVGTHEREVRGVSFGQPPESKITHGRGS